MTPASVERGPWSRQRWWLTIALVLHLQAALIFLLEKSASATPRRTVAVPLIHLREHVSLDLLAISDPTLFVLPHPRGFSGDAWLNRASALNFQPADWTEPPLALPLATARLGTSFKEFIAANPAPAFETIPAIEPARRPSVFFPLAASAPPSTCRIGGALAQRPLLAPLELPVWESSELVGDSVVQVLADAAGRVISAVLLTPGGGLQQQAADARALALAQSAQFAPAANGALTAGSLTFEWHLRPPAATNAPVAAP